MQNTYRNWMAATPGIDTLSLYELSLPGTHNAGSDWKATYPVFPPRHWLACQHDSFYSQLCHGSRALDLRLIADTSKGGADQFQFHHNEYTNSRRLGDLINDVNRFLEENPDEFIILDFHNTLGDFNYAAFNKVLTERLGHRLIPTRNARLSLRELKQINTRQRGVAAAPWRQGINYGLFTEQIEHEWRSASGTTNAQELHQYISGVLKTPSTPWKFWSLSATSYTVAGGPVDIHNELNKWFDPGTSDWAYYCNIINVDFIEETRIVEYCRTMNVEKARHRERAGANRV